MEINKDDQTRLSGSVRENGHSSVDRVLTDLYRGLDHRGVGLPFQRNYDDQGLVLFTRPRLNLSYDNISGERYLLPLLTEDRYSPYHAIRSMLDPTLAGRGVTSPLFDSQSAFIPILTNLLQTISGFPDVTLNTYTSQEGIRKEAWSMVDDVAEINTTYDITATFANVTGDPITSLFHMWGVYMGAVYSGDIVPYPDYILENAIDYQTRIWRITLDNTKTYVKKIGCANVAFPMASPLGAFFNYNIDSPSIRDNDQISIPFRCMAAEYNDPILYLEFNQTVELFNVGMADATREGAYVKLKNRELGGFNWSGYPRINLETYELEWWIPKHVYNEVLES